MFNKNIYIGLDISDFSVKAIQFRVRNNNPKVVSYGSSDLPLGLVEGGEIKKSKELLVVVKDLFENIKGEKIKANYVACSLPEEKSFVRLISLPLMSKKEISEAIKWAAETEIPTKLDELYTSWELIDRYEAVKTSAGSPDSHIDVLLVACPKLIIDKHIRFLKDLGLTPVLLEVESGLMVRSLIDTDFSSFYEGNVTKIPNDILSKHKKRSGDKSDGTTTESILIGQSSVAKNDPADTQTKNYSCPSLIVDIGAHRTNIAIFNGKTLCFTTTIEISGNSFSEILSRELNVDFKKAEKIKTSFGLDKKKMQGKVFDALIPPLTSLTGEITKIVEYYNEHQEHLHNGRQSKIRQVIICGGGALLKGIAAYLRTSLKLDIALGDPWVNFNHNLKSAKKHKLPVIHKEMSLSYATVVGLLLSIKDEYYN